MRFFHEKSKRVESIEYIILHVSDGGCESAYRGMAFFGTHGLSDLHFGKDNSGILLLPGYKPDKIGTLDILSFISC